MACLQHLSTTLGTYKGTDTLTLKNALATVLSILHGTYIHI